MSMTITLHVWRLRPLGHCAMLWGLIFRILLESRFSQASHFRTLILQWGLDPGEWLIWHPHRGAHQHRLAKSYVSVTLEQFRASSFSPPLIHFCLYIFYILIMMKLGLWVYFNFWPGVTIYIYIYMYTDTVVLTEILIHVMGTKYIWHAITTHPYCTHRYHIRGQ